VEAVAGGFIQIQKIAFGARSEGETPFPFLHSDAEFLLNRRYRDLLRGKRTGGVLIASARRRPGNES